MRPRLIKAILSFSSPLAIGIAITACKPIISANGCPNDGHLGEMRSTVAVSHLQNLDGAILWWDPKYPWLRDGVFDQRGDLFAVTREGDIIEVGIERSARARLVLRTRCQNQDCVKLQTWNGRAFAIVQAGGSSVMRGLSRFDSVERSLPLPQGFEVAEALQIAEGTMLMSDRGSQLEGNWPRVPNAPTKFLRIKFSMQRMVAEEVMLKDVHGPVLRFLRDAAESGRSWGVVTPGECFTNSDLDCRTGLGAASVSVFPDPESTEVLFRTALDSVAVDLWHGRLLGMRHEKLCSWSLDGGDPICVENHNLPTVLAIADKPHSGIVLGGENFVFSYAGEIRTLRQRSTVDLPPCAVVAQVNAFSSARIFVGMQPKVRMTLTSCAPR